MKLARARQSAIWLPAIPGRLLSAVGGSRGNHLWCYPRCSAAARAPKSPSILPGDTTGFCRCESPSPSGDWSICGSNAATVARSAGTRAAPPRCVRAPHQAEAALLRRHAQPCVAVAARVVRQVLDAQHAVSHGLERGGPDQRAKLARPPEVSRRSLARVEKVESMRRRSMLQAGSSSASEQWGAVPPIALGAVAGAQAQQRHGRVRVTQERLGVVIEMHPEHVLRRGVESLDRLAVGVEHVRRRLRESDPGIAVLL